MKLIELLQKVTKNNNFQLYEKSEYVNMWNDWYRGKSAKFHNYTIYLGKKELRLERFSLGMAKKVCEDWANLLINEKTDIVLSDEASQNVLNDIYRECAFWRRANVGIEKTFALGIGAFVVSVTGVPTASNGQIVQSPTAKVDVSFVNATKIEPITFEDDRVTECAFISRDSKHTYIAVHVKNEQGFYDIHNFVCEGIRDDSLNVIADRSYVFHTNNSLPWFYILKPNVANNIDIDSPLGVSIFANSIDTLKEIDLVYDSYQNEFALGKKRIYVSAKSFYIDPNTGETIYTFDTNDLVHYILPENDDGQNSIQDVTPPLRVTEHQLALQDQLNLLSYACGFGTEHYKFNAGGIATATQVISENSEMFRNIKKHEILIEEALITITRAVIYAANTFTTLRLADNANIEVKFDDSIIEDKQAEKSSDRLDVSMGVMSKEEFRAKWFNEDIDTATKKIAAMSSMTIVDDEEEPPIEE